PRDSRGDHAFRDARARPQGPFHARSSLRVRSGGVVLALRRRGLAAAFRARVLALAARKAGAWAPRGPDADRGRLSEAGRRDPAHAPGDDEKRDETRR